MNTLDIINKVREGEVDALRTYIELKAQHDQLKTILDEIKDAAIDQAERYGQKSFEAFGAKIELRNGPSQWNFEAVPAVKQAKDRLKYVEEISKLGGGVDPSTGEEIGGAIKVEGRTTIAIKFGK